MSASNICRSECLSLRDLRQGQTAVVEEVAPHSCECARLGALGFRPGAVVKVLTPGNSCAVQLGDSRLVLRGEMTSAIQVSLLG